MNRKQRYNRIIMSRKSTDGWEALGGCGCLIAIAGAIYLPIVYWTNRNLDFWFSYFKGETVDIPLWISFVISLFEPILLLDIIGELLRFAI